MPQRRRGPVSPLLVLRRFTRHATAAGILFGCLLLAAAFVAITVPGNAIARETTGVRADIARLEADLARKQAEAAARQADQYVIDRAHELGYVRPNEALIIVQGEDPAARPTETKVPGRLARWLAVFFR